CSSGLHDRQVWPIPYPRPRVARPVVVVSNRGPLTFRPGEGGELVARRGAGGLVSGLGPLVAGTDALWVAAAMTDGDRAAARSGVVEADGVRGPLLDVDPETHRLHYAVARNPHPPFAPAGPYGAAREP